MFWCAFLSVVLVLLSAFFIYFKNSYRYWKKHGVLYLEPKIPYGNFQEVVFRKKSFGEVIRDVYEKFKNSGDRFFGAYLLAEPILVPNDVDLIKNILARDFNYFNGRGIYMNEEYDPISAHLFALSGSRWKNLRSKLGPSFTSGKMKMMFPTVVAVIDKLVEVIEEKVSKSEPIDIKHLMTHFTIDVIGSVAFGLDSNSLQGHSDLGKYGLRFFEVHNIADMIRQVGIFVFPKFMKLMKTKLCPPEVDSFFINVVKEMVDYRENSKVERKDFMQLLVQMKNQGNLDDQEECYGDGNKLTMEEIAAQCFIFFFAGFETTSSTLTYLFYELAKHQEIQRRVRNEIVKTIEKHESMTYDAISDMTYLEQVVSETLRKYPILPFLPRECSADYQILRKDGSLYTIKKGQKVFVPTLGIHYDPQYYPDPDKFDPERFNEENKASIDAFTYLPFGEGPKYCIGKRFGLLETKLTVAMVLKNYKFVINPKTVEPLEISPATLGIISPKNTVYLDALKV